MRPAQFDYFSPDTIDEAIALLEKYGVGSQVLAGGQSLVPMMKLRLLSPKVLIDIGKIGDLSYIRLEKDRVNIGALATHHMIQFSEIIRKEVTALAEAAAQIGDRLVRNRGTIGGSLSHADPAADYGAVFLGLDGEVRVQGTHGHRTIAALDFFVGPFTTSMKHDELLTEVSFPIGGERMGSSYLRIERVAASGAIIGACAGVNLTDGRKLGKVGIGLCGAGPRPVKAFEAEKFLMGKDPSGHTLNEAASLASRQSSPISDLRGSAEYKMEMVKVFVGDALQQATERASGKGSI